MKTFNEFWLNEAMAGEQEKARRRGQMMKKAKPTYGAPAGGQSQKISAPRPANTISTGGKQKSMVQRSLDVGSPSVKQSTQGVP